MTLQTKGKLLQLRISEAELNTWKQYAEEGGLSMSQLVRNAVNSECEAAAYAKELCADSPAPELLATPYKLNLSASPPHPATKTNKCDHHGYEGRPFCYRCGARL